MPKASYRKHAKKRRTFSFVRRGSTSRTSSLTKIIKRVAKSIALRLCETKTVLKITENVQLFYNLPLYAGSTLHTTQGLLDPDDASSTAARVGDEILLKSVEYKFWLATKLDRPNVMYRIALFWYKNSGASITNADVWFTQTNKMLDAYNNENISIIAQKTLFPQPSFAGAPTQREHSRLITLKKFWKGKRIKYDQGGNIPKLKDIGFVIVAYDAFGTLQTDNIASYSLHRKITFKDP